MPSFMLQEIRQIPDLLRQQAEVVDAAVQELIEVLAKRSMQRSVPRYYGLGWGSSNCLLQWFKFVAASCAAWPIIEWPMALTEDKARVLLDSAACMLAFSQSGVSTDLTDTLQLAKARGALNIAVLNELDSPLGRLADIIMPIGAGVERSIAATKSFFLSATAILYFFAKLNSDQFLLDALNELPIQLEEQEKISFIY